MLLLLLMGIKREHHHYIHQRAFNTEHLITPSTIIAVIVFIVTMARLMN